MELQYKSGKSLVKGRIALAVGMGHFVVSIKNLWEHYCDLDPKTSVSLGESFNGSSLSAALKRRNGNGPICQELLSLRSSFMIKSWWRFYGEGPTPAGGFVQGNKLTILLLCFQSALVFDKMFGTLWF